MFVKVIYNRDMLSPSEASCNGFGGTELHISMQDRSALLATLALQSRSTDSAFSNNTHPDKRREATVYLRYQRMTPPHQTISMLLAANDRPRYDGQMVTTKYSDNTCFGQRLLLCGNHSNRRNLFHPSSTCSKPQKHCSGNYTKWTQLHSSIWKAMRPQRHHVSSNSGNLLAFPIEHWTSKDLRQRYDLTR